jgi:hypothetical protein
MDKLGVASVLSPRPFTNGRKDNCYSASDNIEKDVDWRARPLGIKTLIEFVGRSDNEDKYDREDVKVFSE